MVNDPIARAMIAQCFSSQQSGFGSRILATRSAEWLERVEPATSSRIVGISLILRSISLRRNLNFRKISIPLQLFRSRFAEQFSSRRYCLSGITQSCREYAIFTEYWILSVCDLFELHAPLSITKWYPLVSDFEVFLHDKKQERDEVGIFGKIFAFTISSLPFTS